ncbi:MAG: DUF402 domain-containing protein [Actinomycetota bacterium]
MKWPSHEHRTHTHDLIDVDVHGHWLRVPARSDVSAGPGWEFAAHHDAVLLVPTAAWWTAYWSTHGSIYIDITTPASWLSTHRVTVFDLALDVFYPDGTQPRVLDRDEFDNESPGWPAEYRRRALVALDELLNDFADGPVAAAGWRHLSM